MKVESSSKIPLSDPCGFLSNSNSGSSLLAVQQSSKSFELLIVILMPFTLSVELLLLCSSIPLSLDLSYAEQSNASTKGNIQQEPLCRQWIHLLQLSPTLPGLHKYSSWTFHNKTISRVWLHHLCRSTLNLQQGRSWQLNGKRPTPECSDSSNEAGIVIIALFWQAKLCKPPLHLASCTRGQ